MLSLKNRLYFGLKPFLPLPMRMGLRRLLARRARQLNLTSWPISAASGLKPDGWPGWPDGKEFAFVLTHDVEGAAGFAKCRRLAQLEMELGVRSSFNFIPEGDYELHDELRLGLSADGFEIGVHDLFHDGKLYESLETFRRHALVINRYAAHWGAVGYRSGFMLHNYDWHHLLDVLYDATSFDTDPFEPQPEGVGTIFPFWVRRDDENNAGILHARMRGSALPKREGYVELPYTLPQDSTLFLVLREQSPDIWMRKLDWIVSRGGMALLGVHPDYIQFEDEPPSSYRFPVAHYRRFLEYLRDRYAGRYWQALPREVGAFVHRHRERLTRSPFHPSQS